MTTFEKVYGTEFAEWIDEFFERIIKRFVRRMEINESATELTERNQQVMKDMLLDIENFASCTPLKEVRTSYYLQDEPRIIEIYVARGSIFKPAPDGTHKYWKYEIEY